MAADEDNSGTGKPAAGGEAKPGERRKERRRPPVTIDLTAKEVRQSAAANPAATAAATPAAKPDSAAKPEAAAASAAHAAKPESAARPEAVKPETPPPRPEPAAAAEAPRAQPERPAATGSSAAGAATTAAAGMAAAARAFPKFDDTMRRTAIAGVAGGVIALILVIVLQAIGLLPAPGRSAANEAAEQARAAAEQTASLDRRLTAIEAMVEGLPAMRTDIGALDTDVAALKTDIGTLAAKSDVEGVVTLLGQLRQRLDAQPPSVPRSDVDALSERVGRLEVTIAAGGTNTAASDAAIASLTDKLTTAETALRSLTDRLAAAEAQVADLGTTNPMAGGEAAVRAIAITALRRAADGSQPFTTEVDMVAALGIPATDIADLRPFAERGVTGKTELVAEFPAVADTILTASATGDPDAGFLQRVVSGLGGLVSIRPAGPIPGSDPPAIVSRMTAAVDHGDLGTALIERDGLPDAGKEASAAWANAAGERVALDTLVEKIARSLGERPTG